MREALILIGSWSDGVAVVEGARVVRELEGRSIAWLTTDHEGCPLAIIDGGRVCRRDAPGQWSTVVELDAPLVCCASAGPVLYIGTAAAQVLRFDGNVELLTGFQHVEGRERWYAGSAIVNGVRMGPPLGVRTMAVTCDARVVLANVHVGGIPRSCDGGARWEPTLDIDLDAHDVHAHPRDPRCVIAASAGGLCVSRDAGHRWTVETRGLSARYSAAAGFVGDDILIAVADDHFAPRGKVYRRAIGGDGPLEEVGRGLPAWTEGIVDSRGIASHGATAALIDRGGNLYVSHDAGAHWHGFGERFVEPSGALVVQARATSSSKD